MKLMALSLWLCLLGFIALSNADLLDDILSALKNAVDCTSCHALLIPLQELAHLGNDAFSETFITICQTLKLEDDDVCAGIFGLTGPILAHSLRQFSVQRNTATKFCYAVFGLCSQPPVTPFTVSFPKPAPTDPKKFVSKGNPSFQVVHFSDVHIDRQYAVGADANCTKNICCRNFADHTGPITEPAQPFGNHKCDSPSDLAGSLLDAISQIAYNSKFSIFTGDVVEGAVWLVNKSEGIFDLNAWNRQMAEKVGAPVYGAIGNQFVAAIRVSMADADVVFGSDTGPVNSFPRDDTKTTMDSQWVFDTQSEGWARWIDATAVNQLDHISGSYALVVPGMSLRIISVNTQYCFWLYDTDDMPTDPNGILAFIVSQLQASEDAGQRAWIIGHIPAGKGDIFNDQSNYYDQIVQRYINTIAGQFFGHSHKDEFEISYSDWSNQNADTADSIAFICPALTPTSGNPAFKIYDIDPDTYEVMDAKVFMANISDPTFQVKPTWELYYSARDSYGPLVGQLGPTDPLNAPFWHRLTDIFETNDTAFQLWNTRLSRGGAVSACTGACRNVSICDQRALRSQNNCDAPSPTLALKRRELPMFSTRPDHLDCEGGGVGSIFENLISSAQTGQLGLSTTDKEQVRRIMSRAMRL